MLISAGSGTWDERNRDWGIAWECLACSMVLGCWRKGGGSGANGIASKHLNRIESIDLCFLILNKCIEILNPSAMNLGQRKEEGEVK
jgi:hypothetical protein